jgi:hypothetical protein
MFLWFTSSALISASGFMLYGQVFLQVLIIFFAARKYNYKLNPGNIGLLSFMIWLFFQGIIVGSFGVIAGKNLIGDLIQYTVLWGLGIFAFCVGSTVAKQDSKLEANKLFGKIFIVELGSVFARVDLGLVARSSAGFSFFFPFMVHSLIKGRKFNIRSGLILILSTSITLFVILFSGLRSVFVMGSIMMAISLFHLSKVLVLGSKFTKNSGVNKIRVLYLILLALFALLVFETYQYWSYFFEIIVKRFMQTMFNPDGFQLDPSTGRSFESEVALGVFSESGFAFKELFGLGFGFVFFDSQSGVWVAHVHITPVAYFVRLGFIGVIFWATLLVIPIFRWRTLRKSGVELWVIVIYYLFVLASSFAGFLNLPGFWLLFGYVSTVQVKKIPNSERVNL